MGISSPVFGFLPGRRFLSRKSKFPKPDNFTCSPEDKRRTDLLEEQIDELASLALVEAQLIEKGLGHLCFGEGCHAY